MFYGGQQPAGFMPPTAGGRGMAFNPQQGLVMPNMQAGRPGQFPMQAQQGGRGAPNGVQGMPPNAFGVPAQFALGMQQGGPGGFPPNFAQYNQALAAQAQQAQYGRGAGGRGQPGMQGMQSVPAQMMGGQNMRGRDRGPQYPPQQGRGGMAANSMHQGQMGGFPQQGRQMPMMTPPTVPGIPMPGAEAIMAAPGPQQKQLLGEALFPKIQLLQPKLAGKITGMLLEMDNTELYGL